MKVPHCNLGESRGLNFGRFPPRLKVLSGWIHLGERPLHLQLRYRELVPEKIELNVVSLALLFSLFQC